MEGVKLEMYYRLGVQQVCFQILGYVASGDTFQREFIKLILFEN